jgi:large repetitive protein
MTYEAEVLADSPTLFYKLDESSGSVLNDASGGSRNMTVVSGLVMDAPALIPSSLYALGFNGTGYGTRASEAGDQSATSYSAEVWFKTTVADATLFCRYHNTQGANRIWRLSIHSTGVVRARVTNAAGTFFSLDDTVNVVDGQVHHAVMVVSGFTLALYVDGRAVTGIGWTGSHQDVSTQPFTLGSEGAAAMAPSGASVDMVSFYRHALTAERVGVHHEAGLEGGVLPAPGNVQVTVTSRTSATVTWDDIPEADTFQVEARVRAGAEVP